MAVPATERLRLELPATLARSLERLAAGVALSEVLEALLVFVESESSGDMMASVLLLDADGKRLLHGAAPSLPQEYNAAIHGLEIGPGVGSCGTAAYLGHPVYVTDIASDALWVDFKDLALAHGLRACWSTPFHDPDGRVLGTFAVYHSTPRNPTLDELGAINMISDTVAAAVGRQRRSKPQA